MRRVSTAFAALILAQAAHSAEEYLGRLWQSFPPARWVSSLISPDLERGFLIANGGLLAFGLLCWLWPVRRNWSSARAVAWGWVALETANGLGHVGWSLQQGHYTPGAATAPILLLLALYLANRLATERTALALALRSLLWAMLLPGLVAGYVPWCYFGLRSVPVDLSRPVDWLGLLGIALGIALLAWCIIDFARRGRGTLSPVDPPRALVVQGLYRYVRNPMYLSVGLILLGEVLLTRSRELLGYAIVWFAVVNLFVLGYEEPALRSQFGAAYEDYTASVGRWLPRLRPWRRT